MYESEERVCRKGGERAAVSRGVKVAVAPMVMKHSRRRGGGGDVVILGLEGSAGGLRGVGEVHWGFLLWRR